ncbi:MAG TPA: DUF6580 family putative transport protein [Terracidiphilus sp.]|jgi:hypothetical protein|nr:DUF6580 family putative transport protein [Terracidiphilus sp.]
MPAYLLILVAILSRIFLAAYPHPEWFNFAAVGGALLFFGARRSWREMLAPLAVLIATDYFLTTQIYAYPFRWQNYLITWSWYGMAMALGWILLHTRTTFLRVAAGVVLGPTSFFVASNYAVWLGSLYPHTVAGLRDCYLAALPFYRNDLISTGIVAGLAFGIPVLVRRTQEDQATAVIR